jgi:hypothetical protein
MIEIFLTDITEQYSVLPTKYTQKDYIFIVLLILMCTPTRFSVLGPYSGD